MVIQDSRFGPKFRLSAREVTSPRGKRQLEITLNNSSKNADNYLSALYLRETHLDGTTHFLPAAAFHKNVGAGRKVQKTIDIHAGTIIIDACETGDGRYENSTPENGLWVTLWQDDTAVPVYRGRNRRRTFEND